MTDQNVFSCCGVMMFHMSIHGIIGTLPATVVAKNRVTTNQYAAGFADVLQPAEDWISNARGGIHRA